MDVRTNRVMHRYYQPLEVDGTYYLCASLEEERIYSKELSPSSKEKFDYLHKLRFLI